MKTILLAACMLISAGAFAQHIQGPRSVHKDTSIQEPPIYNVYQGIIFYQGNSSFINNSMGTNPPSKNNIAPFNGNGDYTDPSRNMIPPAPPKKNANTAWQH